MSDHHPRRDPDIAEQNLARLLGRAYQPEHPDPAFVESVHQTLQGVARDEAARRRAASPWQRQRLWALAAAACLAGLIFGLDSLLRQPNDPVPIAAPTKPPSGDPVFANKPADDGPDYLSPRRRLAATAAPAATVGETLTTAAGQRRRFSLPDGSLLYLNQNATVRVIGPRQVRLDRGEVFVEVSPRQPGSDGATFVVSAAGREVKALGTRFGVAAEVHGPSVVVTQGKVKVTGVEPVVAAGQQVTGGSDQPAAAPRASYVLDWARDLIAESESPLVPASAHKGGALVATLPDGQEAQISLRKFHVDVHVEDGFARTTIDQTYFNHTWNRLEGRFYFPLPADAQLSRLAMYVNGELMEGGMVERKEGQRIFQSIVSKMKDPALLEWVDGTTFSMRVFPLERREEKRIVLSYTQKLPGLYGRTTYRFPAGHSLNEVRDWSFHATVKNGEKVKWQCDSHTLTPTMKGGDLLLDASANNVKVDRDVVLELRDKEVKSEVRFSSFEQDGSKYLMLRYRPDLPGKVQRQKRDWVFLCESSAQRDPLLARVQIDVVRTLLANAEHDDTFHVLTAGARTQRYAEKALPVTKENIDAAVKWLDNSHLVGGLDLAQALDDAAGLLRKMDNPYLVHLGSGLPVLGERRDDALARHVPEGTRYVGVGVGKRWNRGFMKSAAEQTGGLFTQINPDEAVAWRAFDLFCTLATPRLVNVQVVDDAEKAVFLCHDTTVSQGEEVCALTRVTEGKLPASVSVSGTLEGKPFRKTFAVGDVAADAGYLPRAWAKLEIDRLLARDAAAHKDEVIKLSKATYVMTPYTSLLVLENEKMYADFGVDRGRKDHWAMYPCEKTIPVVRELDNPPNQRPTPLTVGSRQPASVVIKSVFAPGPIQGVDCAPPPAGTPMPPVGFTFGPVPTSGGFSGNPMVNPTGRPGPGGTFNGNFGGGFGGYGGGLGGGGFGGSMMPGTTPVVPAFGGGGGGPGGGPGGGTTTNPTGAMGPTGGAMPPGAGGVMPAPPASAPAPQPAAPAGPLPNQPPPAPGGFGGQAGPGLGMGSRPGGPALGTGSGSSAPAVEPVFMGGSGRVPPPVGIPALPDAPFSQGPPPAGYGWLPLFQPAAEARRLMEGLSPRPVVYQRPDFTKQPLFTNLLVHAPGLGTSHADVQAVLEAEALGHEAERGRVDPAARGLIEKARQGGWRRVTFLTAERLPTWSLLCDGGGRCAWERTLPVGLKEVVICDGEQLWHLYPELGLGARRVVSRFHIQDLAAMVPWVLPSADDLAGGADLKCLDARTVIVTPKTGSVDVHLVFGDDGHLVERRFVERDGGRELTREPCDFRALSSRLKSAPAATPNLTPDTRTLLIASLPIRSRDHIVKGNPNLWNERYGNVTAEEMVTLFLSEVPQPSSVTTKILVEKLKSRPGAVRGLSVLVSAYQPNWDALLAVTETTTEPVQKYLLGTKHGHAHVPEALRLKPGDGFVARLQTVAALRDQWVGKGMTTTVETAKMIDFVRTAPPALVWLLAEQVIDDPNHPVAGGATPFVRKLLEEAVRSTAAAPDLRYCLRYELACFLHNAGQDEPARGTFHEAHEAMWREGQLPPIDKRFRDTLGEARWRALASEKARELVANERHQAALSLARQCLGLGDASLGEAMMSDVAESVKSTPPRLPVTVSLVAALWEHHQPEAAVKLLDELLAEPAHAGHATLWRLRVWMETEQPDGRPAAKMYEALEKALDLEFRNPAETPDLQAVRRDYASLLGHYQQLADAHATLQQAAPRELVAKVIRVADRWRTLDPEPTAACQAAARVLGKLGHDDLAWDYWTTPLRAWTPEESHVFTLARELSSAGDAKTADRAYRLAFDADPDNYNIFWERVEKLRGSGQRAAARALLTEMVEKGSAPQEQRQRARQELNER